MDWLDQKLEWIRVKLQNQSLKNALILYLLAAVVVTAVVSVGSSYYCQRWQRLVMSRYVNVREKPEVSGLAITDSTGYRVSDDMLLAYYYRLEREDSFQVRMADEIILAVSGFWMNWGTFFYAAAAIVGTALLFYHNKMKEPLWMLSEEANKIAARELDYEIHYNSRDEMGQLCAAFDFMRRELIAGQQQNWEAMEELRKVQAAFAHDLRTPLTILYGYADLLSRYYPQGRIDEEKLIETLGLMRRQIRRLEKFSNTMQELNGFGDLELKRKSLRLDDSLESMRETAAILESQHDVEIWISCESSADEEMALSWEIVREVFENLLANALRYSRRRVQVSVQVETENKFGKKLLLYVQDDGPGFSKEALTRAASPYYRDNRGEEEEEGHFGIGLYICKRLCTAHGGSLSLTNSINGGAIVSAGFLENIPK